MAYQRQFAEVDEYTLARLFDRARCDEGGDSFR